MQRSVIEAVYTQNSLVDVPLEQRLQGVDSRLFVGTNGRQGHGSAGNDAQGHDTQQALGIHLTVQRLQPNAALKFICLLDKVCSLPVMEAGLASNNNILAEHEIHSFWQIRKFHPICHFYNSKLYGNVNPILCELHIW